jgi:hypothetical protein
MNKIFGKEEQVAVFTQLYQHNNSYNDIISNDLSLQITVNGSNIKGFESLNFRWWWWWW